MSSTTLTVNEANSAADISAFLEYPYTLYNNIPAWRPPLRFERKEQLSQVKNPGAAILDRQLFLARRGEHIVGRVAAFINPVHQDYHGDDAGHFGYFDCEENAETGAALLHAAENWLSARGAKKMIGPASHSVNEECGLLVDGFEHPPVLMMPFGRSDYQDMIENRGFKKATDMLAFWADTHGGFPRSKVAVAMKDWAEKQPELSFRKMKRGDFESEVRLAMNIFNDAWSENWGFVPFSEDQIKHMAAEMKPLIYRDGFRVAMLNGEPIAYIWMIPNLNEAIRDIDGRLFPFGWAKLVWRLKLAGVKTSRIPLMGLKKEHQKTRLGVAAVAKICEDVFADARKRGFTHCELSWILEDNKSMIRICEQVGAEAYKTYRMYEKVL